MGKEILLLTDQTDNTDTILSSVFVSIGSLEKVIILNDLDPYLFLSSRVRLPDCILVNSSALNGFSDSFLKSLSIFNQSIPVIMLLPCADPELLLTLLDNKLFNYILFPLSVNKFRVRIEEIIAMHSEINRLKDSFYSHPYFSEFRHDLLNHITIATGYIDLLCTTIKEDPTRMYSTKVAESIQKIQSALSKKN
jgi:response regulator RpfG family c-di-GMP phosphodiesterase